MNAMMIRDRMMNYSIVLNDMLAVLDDPEPITWADRTTINELLDTVMEVNTMMVYHFQCGPISERDMADIRAKVAGLNVRPVS